MTTKTKTPKTGAKGASARKAAKTPLGNTRAIDDNSFVAPKRKPKAEAKAVTLAEALEEAGQTMDELVDHSEPSANDSPARPVGTSNLANTIRGRRKGYSVVLHPNGKKTQNAGDAIAMLLLHVKLEDLKAFSAARFEGKTYDHLNPGHARMCIGNLIRGAAKEDTGIMEWLLAKQPVVAEDEASEA